MFDPAGRIADYEFFLKKKLYRLKARFDQAWKDGDHEALGSWLSDLEQTLFALKNVRVVRRVADKRGVEEKVA